MASVVIVDLGSGNLRSVAKAVVHVCAAARVCVSAEPAVIKAADHLILPGQGAMGAWTRQLNANPALRAAVIGRLSAGPVLGICVGLHALYTHSEENGGTPGLGLFAGTVKHFARAHAEQHVTEQHDSSNGYGDPLKIPHMGWNRVRHTRDHPLWHGIDDQQRFYFVHSYFVDSQSGAEVVGECEYGNVFTAAVARDNLFATQFHPEKSQRDGLRLLENFVNWNGA